MFCRGGTSQAVKLTLCFAARGSTPRLGFVVSLTIRSNGWKIQPGWLIPSANDSHHTLLFCNRRVSLYRWHKGIAMRQKQEMDNTLQPISVSEVYPLSTFMQATGWGRHAMTQARRAGLRTMKVGGRCFVRGVDFMDFLGKLAEEKEARK